MGLIDIILLVSLRGIRGGESVYYIGVFWIGVELRGWSESAIIDVIYRLLSEVMRVERLDNIWPIDITDVAEALRDYALLRVLTGLSEELDEKFTKVKEEKEMMLEKILEELRQAFRKLIAKVSRVEELLEELLRETRRSSRDARDA